ncbi:MAG: cytochrome ubiquinol oxidase subunit I [Pseudomonadales bacterium]|nr:cytochrome ubiquinol oxidase subunit I [Pseudomonadales bacterium]
MDLDPFVLARIQFAANISFHILFPSISIGLAWILFYFRYRYHISGDKAWDYAYLFWVKIFALTFALGVVTGITMSFQFGTNWPGFSEITGNISGPLLGYEVLSAFFMEASFLGIMLFGRKRVTARMHVTATGLVAVGTSLSAFWILSLNSWMQTPAGYEIIDGKFFAVDWFEIIFNPSFPYRLAHVVTASVITSAFFIMGVSAWRIFKNLDGPATHHVLRTGIIIAAIATPAQLVIGDFHGLNTLKYQPAKVAAMEGIWHTEKGAPFTLIAWPNQAEKRNDYAVTIPKLASLILTHELDGEVQGLEDFPDATPPVALVFWSFRVMVGLGSLMILISWWLFWSVLRKKEITRAQLLVLSAMTFSGWVATLAGWWVTEVGRQPYIVYGLVRSKDVVADHPAGMVAFTLIAYLLLYAVLLVAYIGAIRYLSGKPAQSMSVLNELPVPAGFSQEVQ